MEDDNIIVQFAHDLLSWAVSHAPVLFNCSILDLTMYFDQQKHGAETHSKRNLASILMTDDGWTLQLIDGCASQATRYLKL